MKKFSVVLKAAAGAVALICAACASTPPSEKEGINLYVDPETGRYSVDEDASDDAKALADVMNMLAPEQDAVAELTDAEIWRTDKTGNVTHIQSGLICPVNWTGFSRRDAHIYDRDGQNVGCTYLQGESLMSFYAYRNGGTVAEEVQMIMDQVVKGRHPVHTPATISTFEAAPPYGEFAYGVIGYSDGNGIEMKSGVLIKQIAGWRMKIRFTYPVSELSRDEAFIVSSFMGQQDAILSIAPKIEPGSDETI